MAARIPSTRSPPSARSASCHASSSSARISLLVTPRTNGRASLDLHAAIEDLRAAPGRCPCRPSAVRIAQDGQPARSDALLLSDRVNRSAVVSVTVLPSAQCTNGAGVGRVHPEHAVQRARQAGWVGSAASGVKVGKKITPPAVTDSASTFSPRQDGRFDDRTSSRVASRPRRWRSVVTSTRSSSDQMASATL